MKVQLTSPFEGTHPAPTHGTPENSGEGRSVQQKEKVALPCKEEIKQDRASEPKAPPPFIVNGQGLSLRFKTDDVSGIRVIEVVDRESGDVVRQIPPEEVVDFLRRLEDKKGNFVSRRL